MYKLILNKESNEISCIASTNIIFPRDVRNPDYQKFIQNVAEQGMSIVEGPDIIEPSYSELREQEYPSQEDQLDMQFHDQVNGTTTWKDTIQAIKDKYPKTITGGTSIGPVPDWVQEEVDKWLAEGNEPLPADEPE